MEDSKRGVLPMRYGIKLSKKQSPKIDEELKRMSNIPYASTVGSIQFQCTRPDVVYALSVTSRYQACVGKAHWGAVKSILKYLKRTKDMFLIYGGGELILEGYSDASFQSDDDDAKSQSGFVFKLNGGVGRLERVPIIFCDNNGAIAQAKEPRSHHRSKHILRCYHLLREMVSRGDCRMDRVSSAKNTVDPFTKLISQIAHTQHLDKMGFEVNG
ncbi:UNVERIFIED_CONTAM: hypothetical protein Slati_0169700 [Sesamum latifolium]|uniref:Uncharacterized protein n=1 Tax=Sesamum latifolium TaxID=2727402 RepID=A0AAW2YAA4_9LAMI